MVDTPLHDAHHAPEGPGRVDGEEDVVQHDKGEEGACLADAPGLLVAGLVVLVEQLGRDGIDGGDSQWNSGIQSSSVEMGGNVERPQNRGGNMRRWYRCRRVGWREVEEARIGH